MDNTGIVLDNGSGFVKIGISGNDKPSVIIPSGLFSSGESKEIGDSSSYCDDEGLDRDVHFPIKWNGSEEVDYEKLMTLYEKGIQKLQNFHENGLEDFRYGGILFTEFDPNSFTKPTKFFEMVFETLKAPAVYMANSNLLSLYSTGRSRGIVVNFGFGSTSSIACMHGTLNPEFSSGLQRVKGINGYKDRIGGKLLTDYLYHLVCRNRSQNIKRESTLFRFFQELKEEICQVRTTSDNNNERSAVDESSSNMKKYILPDQSEVSISDFERYSVPEVFFNPSLIGYNEVNGIHQDIFNFIKKTDDQYRRDQLVSSIVLYGGGSMIPGIQERLTREIETLFQHHNIKTRGKLKFIAHEDRKHLPWIGGSVLSSLTSMSNLWCYKDVYDDGGGLRTAVNSIFNQSCLGKVNGGDIELGSVTFKDWCVDDLLHERIEFLYSSSTSADQKKDGNLVTVKLFDSELNISNVFLML